MTDKCELDRITIGGLKRPGSLNWVPPDTVRDVLNLTHALHRENEWGPFTLAFSVDWMPYLEGEYILAGGSYAAMSLEDRLGEVQGVEEVRVSRNVRGQFALEVGRGADLFLRGKFDRTSS
jgi:hypothetical protein